MKYIYYNMLIWLLASCSFLEEYSQDTVYVRGYQDLEELLVGEGYMSAYAANSLAYQWGYYPYIHYMQDETEECSSDFVNSDYSRKDQIFGYYTWQQRCGVNEQGTSWADESRDWTKLYYHVNIVNNVIDLIDEQITSSFSSLENLTLFTNSVTACLNNADNVSISPKSLEVSYNTIAHPGPFSILVVFVIPVSLIIGGFIVWFRRRRR